jgi:hypothetical protein
MKKTLIKLFFIYFNVKNFNKVNFSSISVSISKEWDMINQVDIALTN